MILTLQRIPFTTIKSSNFQRCVGVEGMVCLFYVVYTSALTVAILLSPCMDNTYYHYIMHAYMTSHGQKKV